MATHRRRSETERARLLFGSCDVKANEDPKDEPEAGEITDHVTIVSSSSDDARLGTLLVVDMADAKDVGHFVSEIYLGKRRRYKETGFAAESKKRKRAKRVLSKDSSQKPHIFVNCGNDKVLEEFMIEVGPVDSCGHAELTLPEGWTWENEKWRGTTWWATVIWDEDGNKVCEIVEQLTRQDVVIF